VTRRFSFEYETDLIGWGLVSGASLLPDIDLPTSKLGRVLFWLSTRLEKRFGHRTITHSAIAITALALLASPLFLVKPLYAEGFGQQHYAFTVALANGTD
jgi:inner membrane protein